MFEEADSLGVSQGQGRGFAQVFDSTYNPVFKEETARLIKEDKEGKKAIDKQLESIDSGVWFRDQPLVQEKILELQKYAQDNPRNIIKGNTNEALEYKKKITDLKAFVYNSKLAEQQTAKYLFALEQGGDKWDQEESRKTIQQFVESPGNYDFSKFQLIPAFNAIDHTNKLKNIVKGITTETSLTPGFKDLNNNTIYQKFINTVDSKIEDEAKNLWNNLSKSGKEHYDNDVNRYIQSAKNFARESASQTVKTPYVDPKQKQQQKLDIIINNNSEEDISIPYGEEGSKNKIFRKGKSVAVHEVAGNFNETVNLRPSEIKGMRGIPIGVFGIYQGRDGNISDDYFEGDFWTQVGDQAALTFKPKKVRSMARFTPQLDSQGNPLDTKNFRKNKDGEIEVFASTASGGKKWIPIENISIDKNDIKNGSFRGVKLNDDNASWEPYLIGNYKKKLGDKQTNFDIAIPYNEYKGFVGADPKSGNEIKNFEAVVNEKDSEVLQKKTFTRGKEIAGIKGEDRKKASDEVVSKTKEGNRFLKRDEYINKNYDKATLDVYDKYLKYSKGANTVAPLIQMKDYSSEQIEEYKEFLDNPKRKGAPISIKQYFEGQ